jgi:hypothetical protein
MDFQADMQMQVANERIRRFRREAQYARHQRPRSEPIRRTIGRSIIRIGERMAAEPSFRPARTP